MLCVSPASDLQMFYTTEFSDFFLAEQHGAAGSALLATGAASSFLLFVLCFGAFQFRSLCTPGAGRTIAQRLHADVRFGGQANPQTYLCHRILQRSVRLTADLPGRPCWQR